MEQNELKIGDIIEMKKEHPCGSKQWKILRMGVDFKLECVGCGHQIMLVTKLPQFNVFAPAS